MNYPEMLSGNNSTFDTLRRVATESSRPRTHPTKETAAVVAAKTLYRHPNVKIVSFAATGRMHTNAVDHINDSPKYELGGKLSWRSSLERTIAVGPFHVYRAPGSVAFMSCGTVLQPILPRSKCWRLDQQNSKFVLQIRPPYYWRIELPIADAEQEEQARQLKHTLEEILQFEKTECPFQRPFTVIVPAAPKIKFIPWSPVSASAYKYIAGDLTPPESSRTSDDESCTPSSRTSGPNPGHLRETSSPQVHVDNLSKNSNASCSLEKVHIRKRNQIRSEPPISRDFADRHGNSPIQQQTELLDESSGDESSDSFYSAKDEQVFTLREVRCWGTPRRLPFILDICKSYEFLVGLLIIGITSIFYAGGWKSQAQVPVRWEHYNNESSDDDYVER